MPSSRAIPGVCNRQGLALGAGTTSQARRRRRRNLQPGTEEASQDALESAWDERALEEPTPETGRTSQARRWGRQNLNPSMEAASQRPWERCWAESCHEEPTPETKLLGGEKDVTAAPIPDDLLNLDTANLFAPWTETFETCSSDNDR